MQISQLMKKTAEQHAEELCACELGSTLEREGLWTPKRFLEDRRESTGTLLECKWELSKVAFQDDKAVGYLIGILGNKDYIFSIGGAFVFRLAVHADYRNGGIGAALIRSLAGSALERGIEKVTLETWEENRGAQRFYEMLGFKREGEIFDERKKMLFYRYLAGAQVLCKRAN